VGLWPLTLTNRPARWGVPVDIWAVRVDGLWLESGPDGWQLVAAPIEPERLSLVATDIPPCDHE
jgi:hypothetical protein